MCMRARIGSERVTDDCGHEFWISDVQWGIKERRVDLSVATREFIALLPALPREDRSARPFPSPFLLREACRRCCSVVLCFARWFISAESFNWINLPVTRARIKVPRTKSSWQSAMIPILGNLEMENRDRDETATCAFAYPERFPFAQSASKWILRSNCESECRRNIEYATIAN
jgi:hypothetical protein